MKPLKEYCNNKKKNKDGVLSDYEKKTVSRLLKNKVRNQDITYLLNIGRKTTINNARICEVSDKMPCLTDEELNEFEKKQMSWDFKTGLNPLENDVDYLLMKSKDAIIQSVALFNSPNNVFSIEGFLVLANIAWLYLFQSFCLKEKISYRNADKTTQALSFMIEQNKVFLDKVSLSASVFKNIDFLIQLRNLVSHNGIEKIPSDVITKLQASCINYNNTIKKLFGDRNGIDNIFSIALQFASISITQAKSIIKESTSSNILNFVSNFEKDIDDIILNDEEYQFTVTYIAINERNKNQADVVRFIVPGSDGYNEKKEILIKEISEDNKYIYMLKDIVKKSKKTERKILEYINDNKLRDITNKKTNNKKLLKPYIFGQRVAWKYTKEFLNLCVAEIK